MTSFESSQLSGANTSKGGSDGAEPANDVFQ